MEEWYVDALGASEEAEPFVNEYDISSVPNDFNMTTIFNLIESGIVKIPDFQRNYVWDQKRASKLIESIILGLPIPQVFFYESERNNYLIIDGQQRLLTIYFFIKQRFPKAAARNVVRKEFEANNKISDDVLNNDEFFLNFTLKLPEIENNPYHGKKFSTLDPKIKTQFEHMRTLRSIVIRQNAPDDSDSSMFEIFNRLNTGGQNLTAQEIRASLYYSKFYKMMYEINTTTNWRKLINKPEVDTHCKDIEFILRGFALLCEHESYQPSMTKFLNTFSKKAKSFDQEALCYMRDLFVSFLDACSDLSPTDLFTNSRFNVSVFDSIFVATCVDSFRLKKLVEKKIVPESIQVLRKNPEFSDFTQSDTANTKNVLGRIRLAKEIVKFN